MDLSNTNGDRLYESMNDHTLNDGLLEFPMMVWPYYNRNPSKDLCFNDLRLASADNSPPTLRHRRSCRCIIRRSKLSYNETSMGFE